MTFLTVFYVRSSGVIVNTAPNKYIRSKAERSRFCPGHNPNDVSFLYFKGSDAIGPTTHKVQTAGPFHPPYIVDASGTPLVFMERRREFDTMLAQYPTIIVDMFLSMGDNLLRAAAVAEAQRQYPRTQFLCDVLPEYRDVMTLCPEITLFRGYKAHGINPADCGKIKLAEGPLWDPRGPEFGKASLYGLYLNVSRVFYDTTLKLPPGFGDSFKDWAHSIGLRNDGNNIIFHLRSKDWNDKCWTVEQIRELARMIKSTHDCTIFYLGAAADLAGDIPDLVNLAGKTTWLQTVYLLTRSSTVICVDSAVMHLCRALSIPYICLWGHTTPDLILSQVPGPGDIMAPPKKGRVEMQDISPRQVFDHVFPRPAMQGPLAFDPREDVSDFGAQEIIFRYFTDHEPKRRQLVDIGAHGKNSSNSWGLLSRGWKGLLIEANPERYRVCKKDFAGLDVKILNIGVSDAPGSLPLYLNKVVGSSSFVIDWDTNARTGKSIMVQMAPVDEIFKTHNIPDDIDFLSVDIEGMDYQVVKCMFEKTQCRPQMIITEAASYQDPDAFFGQYGYEFLIKLKQDQFGNLIYTRKD